MTWLTMREAAGPLFGLAYDTLRAKIKSLEADGCPVDRTTGRPMFNPEHVTACGMKWLTFRGLFGGNERFEVRERPFCKDCKHHIRSPVTVIWDKCSKANLYETLYVVRGGEPSERGYCTTIRNDDNLCGLDGRWFSPKVVQPSDMKEVANG